jgi:hypothetical protein
MSSVKVSIEKAIQPSRAQDSRHDACSNRYANPGHTQH